MAAQVKAAEMWTQWHDQESQRQQDLLQTKQIDAAHRGHLLRQERTPVVEEEADRLEEGAGHVVGAIIHALY